MCSEHLELKERSVSPMYDCPHSSQLIQHITPFFNFSWVEFLELKLCFRVFAGFIPTFISKLIRILFSCFVNPRTYVSDTRPTGDSGLLVCFLELY